MMRRLLLAALALTALAFGPAAAHQANLSVIEAAEVQPDRFRLRWDNRPTSAKADEALGLGPIWPEGCVERWPWLECADGLSGEIGFAGLGVAQSAAMIRIRRMDGAVQTITLTPSATTAAIRPVFDAQSWSGRYAASAAYFALGVRHIMLGVDHLLFVLGLIWIARGAARLARTITAFTLAHSVTLIAVAFGWVGVPEAFVNAMIALSIAFVGVEILRAERGRDSVTLRRPELVAFGFGLLHGFGFANALIEIGLPVGLRFWALLAFNLGVEAGQLGFVALALALMSAWRFMGAPAPARGGPPTAYAIGAVATFWFLDRAVILLGS
jgi:hydrogenase/urease accessory protein HupE